MPRLLAPNLAGQVPVSGKLLGGKIFHRSLVGFGQRHGWAARGGGGAHQPPAAGPAAPSIRWAGYKLSRSDRVVFMANTAPANGGTGRWPSAADRTAGARPLAASKVTDPSASARFSGWALAGGAGQGAVAQHGQVGPIVAPWRPLATNPGPGCSKFAGRRQFILGAKMAWRTPNCCRRRRSGRCPPRDDRRGNAACCSSLMPWLSRV